MEVPDGRAKISRYLSAAANGEPVERAFASAFGIEPRRFESQLRQYVGRSVYQSVQYTFTDRVETDRGGSGRALTPRFASGRTTWRKRGGCSLRSPACPTNTAQESMPDRF